MQERGIFDQDCRLPSSRGTTKSGFFLKYAAAKPSTMGNRAEMVKECLRSLYAAMAALTRGCLFFTYATPHQPFVTRCNRRYR